MTCAITMALRMLGETQILDRLSAPGDLAAPENIAQSLLSHAGKAAPVKLALLAVNTAISSSHQLLVPVHPTTEPLQHPCKRIPHHPHILLRHRRPIQDAHRHP